MPKKRNLSPSLPAIQAPRPVLVRDNRYGLDAEIIGPFWWFFDYLYDTESEHGFAWDFFTLTNPIDRANFVSKMVDTVMKFPAEVRARALATMQDVRLGMEKELHDVRVKSISGGGFADVVINLPFGSAGPWPEQG